MSEYSYTVPDGSKFIQAVSLMLKREGKFTNAAAILGRCRCEIHHREQFSGSRWNAYRTTVYLYVPSDALALFDNPQLKAALVRICDSVMPKNAGLDVMAVEAVPDLEELGSPSERHYKNTNDEVVDLDGDLPPDPLESQVVWPRHTVSEKPAESVAEKTEPVKDLVKYHPKVFISYSHDSPEHKRKVLDLADRLCHEGVDCNIDQYEVSPALGWLRWMHHQIEWADFVLTICTKTYEARFWGKEELGKGLGVQWEGAVISQELFEHGGKNEKFVPVVLTPGDSATIPTVLRSSTHFDVSTDEGYWQLYRRLTNQPLTPKPVVGSVRVLPGGRDPRVLSPAPEGPVSGDPLAGDVQTVLQIIRERTKHLLPGISQHLAESEISHLAVLRGMHKDNALRAVQTLIDGGLLYYMGHSGPGELGVNYKKLKVMGHSDFDAFVIALYLDGDNGKHSVPLSDLRPWGLSGMQVFKASEEAEVRGLVISCGTFDQPHDWLLTPKGTLYAEALLEVK